MNRSFGHYCLLFVLYSVMTYALVFAIVYGLAMAAPDVAQSIFASGGAAGIGVVTIIMPAMLVAQAFHKNEARKMTRGEGWGMAFVFTILAGIVNAAVIYGGLQLQPMSSAEWAELQSIWDGAGDEMAIIAGVVFAIYFLLMRFMLWAGLRGEIKKAERLAAKAARKG